MKTYKLFLDDIRNPSDCVEYTQDKIYNSDWVVVRSHKEFVEKISELFSSGSFPDLISFDHDLAFDHYGQNSEDSKELNGNDCAKFLVEFCLDNSLELPNCLVHSMNPVGKLNILRTLSDFRKIKNSL
jgi:hypothetical protein